MHIVKKKSVTAEIQPEYNQNTTKYKQNTVFKIQPNYTKNTLRIHYNENTPEYIRVRITPYSGAKVLDPAKQHWHD